MDERENFINTLQVVIKKLQEEGIITEKQLQEKLEIPIEWFYSRGIDRRILTLAMENICKKVNPSYKNSLKRSYAINTIKIFKRNGKIQFQIVGRDNWTCFNLSDESFHQKGKIETFSCDEFVEEMSDTIRKDKYNKLKKRFKNLSNEEIENIISITDDPRCQENESKGMSVSLSEMIKNFGEYYRYLYKQKDEVEQENIEVISGGLIEQDVDQLDSRKRGVNNGSGNPKAERVNEVYAFEERDEIFRSLKPMKIISFDSVDENSQVQKGTYTSYIYCNNRENGGYFLISEPYQGDKSCRAVYMTDEFVEQIQEGDENPNFWVDIARTYLEMSYQEFYGEESTYTFKHRTIENYAAKMRYIISGQIDSSVSRSVIYSAKMNLSQLFGIDINRQKLARLSEGVTRDEMEQAGQFIGSRAQEKVNKVEEEGKYDRDS